ncbi:hypothetical protein AKJ09_09789 [Labilithrix luteola]|uniref:Tetratricopeptide repeat protein n=1 Tax=Labilithrix luteola TaxID=1391654 RepID=A0A0K1QBG2_9BACT|nr:hypothetical protein AKJ09_09789 [Labilithrix luteola]
MLSYAVFRGLRPSALLAKGRWREAREAAERLGKSPLRWLPTISSDAAYLESLCLHFEGDFEASERRLGSVADVRGLRYARLTLHASNLVMLERDPEAADAALDEARRLLAYPEDDLLRALAKLALGRSDEAETFFLRAGTTRSQAAPSPKLNDPVFHFFRGLYLVKTGRVDEAQRDLETAATIGHASVYAARARALLPSAEQAEREPRSSLVPVVADE